MSPLSYYAPKCIEPAMIINTITLIHGEIQHSYTQEEVFVVEVPKSFLLIWKAWDPIKKKKKKKAWETLTIGAFDQFNLSKFEVACRVRLDWTYYCWNWKLKTENSTAK